MIEQIEFLPAFPDTAAEVTRMIEDPGSSASDLARRMDPSIAGRVLKEANAVRSGQEGAPRIGSVEQAVATIGYGRLSSMLHQMPFLSDTDGKDVPFDAGCYVRHCLSAAVLARTLASAFGLGDPASAYAGGLLHDVGIVVEYRFFEEEWRKVRLLTEEGRCGGLRAERAVFGTDHACMGSMLLESWHIPERIVASVRLHHSREETGGRGEPYAVWLANTLATVLEPEKDLAEFDAFFRKQRELLESEMADALLLGREVDLFETAYDELTQIGKPHRAGAEG